MFVLGTRSLTLATRDEMLSQDVLKELVGDDLVHEGKVGISTFYWAFPGEVLTKKQAELQRTQAAVAKQREQLEGLRQKREQMAREAASSASEAARRLACPEPALAFPNDAFLVAYEAARPRPIAGGARADGRFDWRDARAADAGQGGSRGPEEGGGGGLGRSAEGHPDSEGECQPLDRQPLRPKEAARREVQRARRTRSSSPRTNGVPQGRDSRASEPPTFVWQMEPKEVDKHIGLGDFDYVD